MIRGLLQINLCKNCKIVIAIIFTSALDLKPVKD